MNGRPRSTRPGNGQAGRLAARRGRALTACAILLLASRPVAPAAATARWPRDAVLVNVTERDLNRIAEGLMRALGGPVLEGTRESVSRGIHDLRYRAELSEPRVTLDEQEGASLALRIREAAVRVGRLERPMGRRSVACEGAGLVVEPDRPVDLRLALKLAIRNGELRILPERAWVSDPVERFRLVKPSACRNTLLPRWLLWWLGKLELRRRLEKLDEVVLATARRMASELGGEQGLLRWSWPLSRSGGERGGDLALHPTCLDTRDGSLLVALATSGGPVEEGGEMCPERDRRLPDNTFLALSESFLGEVVQAAFRGAAESPRRTGGDLRKLLRSSSIYALLPGLRKVGPTDDLYLTFSLRSLPRVELRSAAGSAGPGPSRRPNRSGDTDRPVLRVDLAGIEIRLWKALQDRPDAPLGSVVVETATLDLAPYLNVLGGFSFELLANRWKVRSEGIEADEPALDATLQEVMFGEVFATRSDPLARNAFRVGPTEFRPRSLRVVGDYLVIGFDEG